MNEQIYEQINPIKKRYDKNNYGNKRVNYYYSKYYKLFLLVNSAIKNNNETRSR